MLRRSFLKFIGTAPVAAKAALSIPPPVDAPPAERSGRLRALNTTSRRIRPGEIVKLYAGKSGNRVYDPDLERLDRTECFAVAFDEVAPGRSGTFQISGIATAIKA